MDFVKYFREQAKLNLQRIVLPEATEPRTLQAANYIIQEKIANIILIGKEDFIFSYAEKENLTYLKQATIIDPLSHQKIEEYANLVVELRKQKGVDIDTARE
jgi:phosphate acetyltransferase